jgi:hypothetical protein
MKAPQYYIWKRFGFLLACIIAVLIPFQLCAQEDNDSTQVYSDTSISTVTDDDDASANVQKYSDPILRTVPDTTVERLKKEKGFAYANDPAYWTKQRKVYRKTFWDYVFDFFASDLVKMIFYIVVGALILFVLYRIIIVNDLFIFYSSRKKRLQSEESALAEIDPVAIDKKIQEAIDARDYNSAVRYLYLKTLYRLNDKKWIQFHSEGTNREYLIQMSQHKRSKEFGFLTQVYEYVWYGKFEINEQQFALVHNNFKSFQAGI